MDEVVAYGGVLLTGLVAATLLPVQSEFLLAGLDASGRYDTLALVVAATVGNVLGATINWTLGRYLIRFRDRRWFPIKPSLIDRATAWFNRWGVWSLLLAWAPFVGDPLTLAAGILRVRLVPFLLLVTAGKAARYAAVVAAV